MKLFSFSSQFNKVFLRKKGDLAVIPRKFLKSFPVVFIKLNLSNKFFKFWQDCFIETGRGDGTISHFFNGNSEVNFLLKKKVHFKKNLRVKNNYEDRKLKEFSAKFAVTRRDESFAGIHQFER